ncbi:hypothetical protein AAMO2058_000467100 [Amorphochlora amoebiformis]
MAGLLRMDKDERKKAVDSMGLKKVSHRSRLRKRLEQIKKILENPEKALSFYKQAAEDSKGLDYAALLMLSDIYATGKGISKDEKKSHSFEIQAKSVPAWVTLNLNLLDETEKSADKGDAEWKFIIKLYNSKGSEEKKVELKQLRLPETTKVRNILDPHLMPQFKALGWKDYSIWSDNEAILSTLELRDLSYSRNSEGRVEIQCFEGEKVSIKSEASENGPAESNSSKIQLQKFEECVVCLEENDFKQYLACLHAACCADCWKLLDKCPICNKRKM